MARLMKSDRPSEPRGRRLSFKTRERKAGVRVVRVVTGSVPDIAAKFNAVVVGDEERERVLLKKLHTQQQGAVRAAVQKFETMQGHKVVLVRKNSIAAEVKEEKGKPKVHPKPNIERWTAGRYVKKDLKELIGKDKKFSLPKTQILGEVLNESPDEGREELCDRLTATVQREATERLEPKSSTDIKEKNNNKVREMKNKLFSSTKSNSSTPVKSAQTSQFNKDDDTGNKKVEIEEKLSVTIPKETTNSDHSSQSNPTIVVTVPSPKILEQNPESTKTVASAEEMKNIRPNRSFLWGASAEQKEDKPVENKVVNVVAEPIAMKTTEVVVGSRETNDRLVEDKENLEQLETPVIRKVDKKGYGKINPQPNSSSLYRDILQQNLIEELKEKQEGKAVLKDRTQNVPAEEPLYKNNLQDTYEDIAQDTYEVIENSYAEIKEEAIYDDVLNVNNDQIYESIYNGRLPGDSDSSCEQSNSLYDIRPSSRASSGSVARLSGASRSDTSDDWIDIELDTAEEQKQHVLLIDGAQKRAAGSWSQKVRRQWSARKTNVVQHQEDSDSSSKHYELVENHDDDSAVCDDFEFSSDSEFSVDNTEKPYVHESVQETRMREGSQSDGIYGLMKEAGKRMRKTSSTIGKSLRRISRISKTTSAQDIFNGSNGMMSRGKWPSFKKKNSLPQTKSTFYLTDSGISVASIGSTNSVKAAELSSIPPPRPPPPTVDTRRLSMSMRPTSPPPPPPSAPLNGTSGADNKGPSNKAINDTSLYAECGLFEQNPNPVYQNVEVRRAHGNSWYSEIGLYENSKPSDASSDHDSCQGSDIDLRFADEPLYQFYTERVASRELAEDISETGYEEIGENRTVQTTRPSALELVNPEMQRTLWCQVPQVIDSGILDSLSIDHKRLQEAKFEVVTSEASYYKSLMILEKHFAASPLLKDESVLPKVHYKTLFSNVPAVRKCSEAMLAALDKCWQDSILLEGISDVIDKVAEEHFSAYIKYCKHQQAMERTIKTLKKSNQAFSDALDTLQKSPKCHNLSFYSFVLLPMQRITRMPLLQDAILTKLSPADPEYESCRLALARLNKIVHDCNESARQTERMEEMALLSRSIQFPPEIRPLPLLSASRWLVRSGDVSQISLETRTTFSRKLTASRTVKLRLFLFSDYLVVAKKKGEDTYMVVTYCERNLAQMSDVEEAFSNKFLIMLTLLKNHEGKLQEMVLCCGGESSRARWISAMSPPSPTIPGETLYEDWDCPQVFVQHAYLAVQPDELSLQFGDVINVLRKTDDGWYYGERMRDSESGWFPGNHTAEIPSSHVRARNLKQRYRLLALSSSFIQKQQLSKLSAS